MRLPNLFHKKKVEKTIEDYQKEILAEFGKKQFKRLQELGTIFSLFQVKLR